MASTIRVEINGTDKTSSVLNEGLTIERALQQAGACQLAVKSPDASYRPSMYQSLEVWEPCRRVTDAAITAGDTTLTSATAAFVAADVGTHVRIAGAGVGGAALRTVILSRTSATEVEVEDEATGTVSGAELLVGRSRFLGYVTKIGETRLAGPSTLVAPLSATDKAAHLGHVYPVLTRSAETLYDRLVAIVGDGLDEHGIVLSFPIIDSVLLTEAGDELLTEAGDELIADGITDQGSTLAAADYTGLATASEILDALMVEDANSRLWRVDSLGRLRVTTSDYDTLPASLTAANVIRMEALKKEPSTRSYRNVQFVFYGDPLTRVSSTNSSERTAVGPYMAMAIEEDLDATTAQDLADNLIALYATRSRYLLQGLTTLLDGIDPGQSGTITLTERDVSGTHLVQSVRAVFINTPTHAWLFELSAVNGLTRVSEWREYWGGLG